MQLFDLKDGWQQPDNVIRRQAMQNNPSSQNVAIPVGQVAGIEVAFEGRSLSWPDKAWRRKLASGLMELCWPAFIGALKKDNPSTKISVDFVNSFLESTRKFTGKAEKLHSVLVAQRRTAISKHPSKGPQRVAFVLCVFWRMDPPPATKTVIFMDDDIPQVVPAVERKNEKPCPDCGNLVAQETLRCNKCGHRFV
jgi:hypothetical protein